MKRIAILLTVFNRKEITIKCLNNVYNQHLPYNVNISVFLTDDGSSDGTSETIKDLYPDITIIKGDGSLYWNRGMWTAWNEASKGNYDAYLWLNNDTFLYSKAINKLLEISVLMNDESIVVGAIESTKMNNTTTYGGYIKGKRIDPSGRPQKIDYFNGNVVLIPKYVFEVVGNLDYKYRHSFGDFDYGLRAKKNGISSFLSDCFVGNCDRHEKLNNWCNPEVSFKDRVRCLFLPTGYPPLEVFYYERKHNNMLKALFHQCTLWMRVLFPSLWVKMGHRAKP